MADGGAAAHNWWQHSLQSAKFAFLPQSFRYVPIIEHLYDESSFQMLVLNYGVQLLFSSTFCAQRLLCEQSYRELLLRLSQQHRPFIVQLCAEDGEVLANAAEILRDSCDGLVLNPYVDKNKIDCKKDSCERNTRRLEVSVSQIKVASRLTTLPIACCLFVNADNEKNSNEILQACKDLHAAGCQMLVVQNQAKELSSAFEDSSFNSFMRKIREEVEMAICVRGSVVCLNEAEKLLTCTGADMVTCQDSLLQAPCLFSDQQHSLLQVASTYLHLCGTYNTHISAAKNHVIKMCAPWFASDGCLRKRLSSARSLSDLSRLLDESFTQTTRQGETDDDVDSVQLKHLTFKEVSPANMSICQAKRVFRAVACRNGGECDDEFQQHRNRQETSSKNVQRKRANFERKREARKQRFRERRRMHRTLLGRDHEKQERRKLDTKNLLAAEDGGQKICIDLSFSHHMSQKEMSKLAQQIGRVYSSNRRCTHPAHVVLTAFDTSHKIYDSLTKHCCGFHKYIITKTALPCCEYFDNSKLVYLTPDAEACLLEIDPNVVYIIGGLVDETGKKNMSKSYANDLNLAMARLPIQEHMDKTSGKGSHSTVLTINQVFDILMAVSEMNDWKSAFSKFIPKRKGLSPKLIS